MANDILEEYFLSAFASKMRTINLAEYTTLLMIMEVISLRLSKNFPTISLVMRKINRHVLQHLMNNRVWIFSNSWTTDTRSQVFTFLTELMSIIMWQLYRFFCFLANPGTSLQLKHCKLWMVFSRNSGLKMYRVAILAKFDFAKLFAALLRSRLNKSKTTRNCKAI